MVNFGTLIELVKAACEIYGIKSPVVVDPNTNGVRVEFASIHLCTEREPGEMSREVRGFEVLFWTADSGVPGGAGGDDVGEWKHSNNLYLALSHMFNRLEQIKLNERLCMCSETLSYKMND